MNLVNELWADERGFILSAEMVTVGTVALLGATVGLKVAEYATNKELQDFAAALRGLNQSYSVSGYATPGAATAGSGFSDNPQADQAEILAIDIGMNGVSAPQPVPAAPLFVPAPSICPAPGSVPPSLFEQRLRNWRDDTTIVPPQPSAPTQQPKPAAKPDKTDDKPNGRAGSKTRA